MSKFVREKQASGRINPKRCQHCGLSVSLLYALEHACADGCGAVSKEMVCEHCMVSHDILCPKGRWPLSWPGHKAVAYSR